MQDTCSPGQGFSRQFRELECLGAGQPKISIALVAISKDFDIGKKLWGVLHLVNEDWRLMHLKKHLGIALCKRTLVQIVECHIAAVRTFHQFLKHCCLAHLTRTGHDDHLIFVAGFHDDLLQRTLHISHIITTFRVFYVLIVL